MKNRYQILTHVKNRYQILTSVKNLYQMITCEKLISKLICVKNWYQILTHVKNWYQIIAHMRYFIVTDVSDKTMKNWNRMQNQGQKDPGKMQQIRGILSMRGIRMLLYPFFVRNIWYINFVTKSVRRPSIRDSVRPSVTLSVHLSVCPYVTFLVIVSSPKPLDVATSNFVDA